MSYDVQISWLRARISTLKYKDNRTIGEESDLAALEAILEGYTKAQLDSVALSWIQSPDMMGR